MTTFKCAEKNLVVTVRLRQNGKVRSKHIYFDDKGEVTFETEDGWNGRLIERLRREIGTGRIKGLKETGGKKK